ncbi:nucleotidyltransferase domain-containing protein [Ruminococcus sp. 5_1_39BFAA]|uniref:nucleotidyltransferase domain-containing protein n=1 Tax=Ruminococcus sp. 5_1_39BFAA TaxID=457412 RepID=UPI003568A592
MEISDLLKIYAGKLRKIFTGHLKKVILYGSYARGDFNEFSDIDIMVLTDYSEDEIRRITSAVADLSFDMEMDYGIRFSPVIENEDHFTKWVKYLPYYRNVSEEGVTVNG